MQPSSPFQGDEVFEIQKSLYRKASGFFGLSNGLRDGIAIGLDGAVIFGMLLERCRPDGVSTETLLAELRSKMQRLK